MQCYVYRYNVGGSQPNPTQAPRTLEFLCFFVGEVET